MNCEYTEREQIHLVERLWQIECLHLLGSLSEPEYRRALAAVRTALPPLQGEGRGGDGAKWHRCYPHTERPLPAERYLETETTLEMEYE